MPPSQGIHLDVTLARDASVRSAALHRRIPPLGLRGDWKEAALAETHTAAEQSAQRLPHVAHVPHGSAGKAPAPRRRASRSCLPAPPRRASPFLAPQLAQRQELRTIPQPHAHPHPGHSPSPGSPLPQRRASSATHRAGTYPQPPSLRTPTPHSRLLTSTSPSILTFPHPSPPRGLDLPLSSTGGYPRPLGPRTPTPIRGTPLA